MRKANVALVCAFAIGAALLVFSEPPHERATVADTSREAIESGPQGRDDTSGSSQNRLADELPIDLEDESGRRSAQRERSGALATESDIQPAPFPAPSEAPDAANAATEESSNENDISEEARAAQEERKRQFEQQMARQSDIRRAIELEAVDPDWAYELEPRLAAYVRDFIAERPEVLEHLAFSRARCKTTICDVQLFDYGSSDFPSPPYPILDLQNEIIEQPWATQFDNPDTHNLGQSTDGLVEYRIYFKKTANGDSQVQSLRVTQSSS